MRSRRRGPLRSILASLLCAGFAAGANPVRAETPLHALLLGGGPDRSSNTAQIEGHVRFVAGLLPAAATRTVLFADGHEKNATVSFSDSSKMSDAQRALEVLLPAGDFGAPVQNRPPDLHVPINGPARLDAIRRAFAKLAAQCGRDSAPALIYTAGHGGSDPNSRNKSVYDLWNGQELSVRDLAGELARLPAKTPVVLVMAQCFSGGFANVIFRNGDDSGEFSGQDIAGFFSAAADREAAGCGAEVGAPDYQDFSSRFFGALSGRNLLGEAVNDADADGDGRVSLHEAFCNALIHDESIDSPTCTSQAFLKRFVPMSDPEIYSTPFSEILTAATPAEQAALKAISARLFLVGEHRPLAVYDLLTFADPSARPAAVQARDAARDHLRDLRARHLQTLFTRWPRLRWTDPAPPPSVTAAAIAAMEQETAACREILDAQTGSDHAEDAVDNEEAFLLRFAGLCESIVRRKHLRAQGDATMKAQFEKIWAAENRSLPLKTAAQN